MLLGFQPIRGILSGGSLESFDLFFICLLTFIICIGLFCLYNNDG